MTDKIPKELLARAEKLRCCLEHHIKDFCPWGINRIARFAQDEVERVRVRHSEDILWRDRIIYELKQTLEKTRQNLKEVKEEVKRMWGSRTEWTKDLQGELEKTRQELKVEREWKKIYRQLAIDIINPDKGPQVKETENEIDESALRKRREA